MSEPIIKVENLGKKYNIGDRQSYYSLRDTIVGFFDGKKKKDKDEFWALKDINFEVKRGESIGIIGRNGAGKSTLLKILSQITPPTTGKITMRGRVASLLEVGTGFNPELTGRENIFLNGAILGMSQAEIKKKFDEIVAFSEVEKFLDMPVKHYSSGMYMRLAFAVAAHLESEILIVDEVLAVGDAQFQKKCLGKMNDVAKKEGRTVLFVSHNMVAVQTLCNKAIYLKAGRIVHVDLTEKIINEYLSDAIEGSCNTKFKPIIVESGFQLKEMSVSPNPVKCGSNICFKMKLYSLNPLTVNALALIITSNLNVRVAIIDLREEKQWYLENQFLCVEGIVKKMSLVEGDYRLSLYVKYNGDIEVELPCSISLNVCGKTTLSKIIPYPPSARGLVELDLQFKTLVTNEK